MGRGGTCLAVNTYRKATGEAVVVVVERARSKSPRIYNVIDIIIAPEYAPPVNPLTAAGVEHPLAQEVMAAVRQHGPTPVALWKLINSLANARNPDYRARRRCWRLRYWGACRELLKAKLLVRHGPLIAPSEFACRPKPRSQDRRLFSPVKSKVPLLPSVGASTSKTGGSSSVVTTAKEAGSGPQAPEIEVVVGNLSTLDCPSETQSAPAPELVSKAASALARLPRNQPRKPTGWLHGQHCWRGRLLELPDGEVAALHWCSRGRVLLSGYREDPLVDENTEFIRHLLWAVRREKDVRLHKRPEAVLLGSQKAGKVERRSEAKARAARLNGLRPCRPGKRRGRPTQARRG